jgi:hypothetical protein
MSGLSAVGLSKVSLLSVCAILWSTTVCAQDFTPIVTPGSSGKGHETQAYLGLAWQLGANRHQGARIVVGVRAVEVDENDVLGLDLNAWFDPKSGLDRIALTGLGGSRSLQVHAGVGYDFSGQQPIVTAAAQGPGLRLGVDYGLNQRKFVPYVEANALTRPDSAAASASTLSCSEPGYVLVTRDDLTGFGQDLFDDIVANGLDIDGRACVDSGFID